MTIRVDIQDAQERLTELLSAASRGEEVILDEAGEPRLRLTAVRPSTEEWESRAAKRRSAIGMFKHLAPPNGIDIRQLRFDDRWDERNRIKFGPPD